MDSSVMELDRLVAATKDVDNSIVKLFKLLFRRWWTTGKTINIEQVDYNCLSCNRREIQGNTEYGWNAFFG